MNLFITYLWRDPRLFFAVAVLVIISICTHEFVHAYTALKLGDDTAARNGHLTFNPLKQMGVFSLLLFCLFGLAWGRVPVNPANLRGKYAPALVAFSGPLSNIVLSQIFILLTFICFKAQLENEFAISMLFYGAHLNIVLFILNMLPVPGFDGYAIICNMFPKILRESTEAVRGAIFLLIMLLFAFFNQLFQLARVVAAFELVVLQWLTK